MPLNIVLVPCTLLLAGGLPFESKVEAKYTSRTKYRKAHDNGGHCRRAARGFAERP